MTGKLIDAQAAVNWNSLDEQIDLDVWNRSTTNLWVPERIPLSNDLPSWSQLSPEEQTMVMHVFTGLTLLDTMQGTVGCVEMMPDSRTMHEEAVLSFFCGVEAIHARSYSSIFSTLCSTAEINESFRWSENDVYLQNKARIILKHYRADDPLKKKIISVFLETFSFVSGFYASFKYASRGKLTNTADIIRLINRDEQVHGFYIGTKFQYGYAEQSDERKQELEDYAYDMLIELFDNEVLYARELYDEVGWTEDVIEWMKFNANRALQNLGFGSFYPNPSPSAEILTQADPSGNETHDFFSGTGSSYTLGAVEATTDDDWADFD